MTAVWQSLIPETQSTEPLALPQSPDSETGGLNPPNFYANHNHNNLPSPASYDRIKPVVVPCGNSNLLDPGPNDNNNGNRPEEAPNKSAFHRFASSMNRGDQFWKLYSDRCEGTNHHSGESPESRNRYFLKSGVYNTRQINVFERTQRFIRDIFTTLVDTRWRWTLFLFSISYVLSWLVFATIWFLIFLSHGDMDHLDDPSWEPCVVGIKNFASVFLFSLETQHTIGYGTRYINDNCPDAILTLVFQSITGILLEAFLVGVVFAKLSRPKKRSQTLIFSKNAVISVRDGKLYLMVRVGDLRNRSSLLEAHVRAQVITRRVTLEGEVIPLHQEEIKIGGYAEDEDRLLLFWPTVVVHLIDSSSPFYSMSAGDLLKAKLELVLILEGVVESTGMTTQLRTSYLPEEILWGRRFRDLSSYKTSTGQHIFDFELFNATFPVEMPLCSAQDLDQVHLLKTESVGHTGIIISDASGGESHVKEENEDNLRQKRNNIELTIINGRGEERRASMESSDEDFRGNHNSSDEPESSDDSDGRGMCHLRLPGGGKKRKRSSTYTCSTNASDSNV